MFFNCLDISELPVLKDVSFFKIEETEKQTIFKFKITKFSSIDEFKETALFVDRVMRNVFDSLRDRTKQDILNLSWKQEFDNSFNQIYSGDKKDLLNTVLNDVSFDVVDSEDFKI